MAAPGEKSFCVLEYHTSKSVVTVQRAFRAKYSWVRIPPGSWMFVCCEDCVMSARGLCDEFITRPGESYRLRCFVVCDLATS